MPAFYHRRPRSGDRARKSVRPKGREFEFFAFPNFFFQVLEAVVVDPPDFHAHRLETIIGVVVCGLDFDAQQIDSFFFGPGQQFRGGIVFWRILQKLRRLRRTAPGVQIQIRFDRVPDRSITHAYFGTAGDFRRIRLPRQLGDRFS